MSVHILRVGLETESSSRSVAGYRVPGLHLFKANATEENSLSTPGQNEEAAAQRQEGCTQISELSRKW